MPARTHQTHAAQVALRTMRRGAQQCFVSP